MHTGYGETIQDESALNFLSSKVILQHQSQFKVKPQTGPNMQSPHYMVMNDNQFSIGSPRYPITSGASRPRFYKSNRDGNFSMNINRDNNQQVFIT